MADWLPCDCLQGTPKLFPSDVVFCGNGFVSGGVLNMKIVGLGMQIKHEAQQASR